MLMWILFSPTGWLFILSIFAFFLAGGPAVGFTRAAGMGKSFRLKNDYKRVCPPNRGNSNNTTSCAHDS
jgi:hypothetical protein